MTLTREQLAAKILKGETSDSVIKELQEHQQQEPAGSNKTNEQVSAETMEQLGQLKEAHKRGDKDGVQVCLNSMFQTAEGDGEAVAEESDGGSQEDESKEDTQKDSTKSDEDEQTTSNLEAKLEELEDEIPTIQDKGVKKQVRKIAHDIRAQLEGDK